MVSRILSDLDLPFVTFNQFGRLIEVSPAAERMVARDELPKLEILCQGSVRRVVAARGDYRHRLDAETGVSPSAEVGAISVSIRALPPGDADRVAVGVLSAAPMRERTGADVLRLLTPREQEVARLLANGASTKAISHALGRSIHTVRRHTDRIFAKTGVGSRTQLACKIFAG